MSDDGRSMSIGPRSATELIVEDTRWQTIDGLPDTLDAAVSALAGHDALQGRTLPASILLCDDARVQALNAQFRGKDTSTNVLSFPSGDDDYIGDIALAFETVTREARDGGLACTSHASHLVVHGLLHLLSYNHERDDDAMVMELIEVDVLASLGIADPYGDLKRGKAGSPDLHSAQTIDETAGAS
ncbi:MAG: rRNA maturation RNase YbeY [Pseudomonadota bacterium]